MSRVYSSLYSSEHSSRLLGWNGHQSTIVNSALHVSQIDLLTHHQWATPPWIVPWLSDRNYLPVPLLVYPNCYWYTPTAAGIPQLLLVYPNCYWYTPTATSTPTATGTPTAGGTQLLLVYLNRSWYPNCYWYTPTVTGIPQLLLVYPHCYWYTPNATGIPQLLLVYPNCYWHPNCYWYLNCYW